MFFEIDQICCSSVNVMLKLHIIMAMQHMLFRHFKKRDEYDFSIVAISRRIGFADESSEKDKKKITTWNIDHKQLIFFVKKTRRHIEKVVFMLT